MFTKCDFVPFKNFKNSLDSFNIVTFDSIPDLAFLNRYLNSQFITNYDYRHHH